MRDPKKEHIILLIILLLLSGNSFSQCVSIPISLKQRVSNSVKIVKGNVREKTSYKDELGNIYTLNKIEVSAYLKGYSPKANIGVITVGGQVGNEMQISYPALKLNLHDEYVFFLKQNDHIYDNKMIRANEPEMIQSMPYADMQGAIKYQNGKYIDALQHYTADEETLFGDIFQYTGQEVIKPNGSKYSPVISGGTGITTATITSFTPTSTNAGTIVAGDFITITGTGFGATAGDVYFTNADDGGASFIASGLPTDITAWSNTSITVKVPDGAGTGVINVNGVVTSASALTVDYSHSSIISDFDGFPDFTRQRYYLRNINGNGGYTFSLNSTSGFSSTANAVASFSRALETWRCNTYINWEIGGTTTDGFADDGTSSVLFDGSLPAGTLARANSRFSGASQGGCTVANTVWWLTEVDIQVSDPPDVGYSWQYGPAMPAINEYDFETTMLHELGHAHGLGHRIAAGEIMDYALWNGTAIRTLDGTDVAGGVNKLNYSKVATCFDPAGSGTFMITLNSSNCGLLSGLPVELISFDAKKVEDHVLLKWTTASEINSYNFIVERSRDGVHFEEIGRVDGAGNSDAILNYYFTDEDPYEGISYYRLKHSDFSGAFSYSQIKAVNFEKDKTYFVKVQPNPATDKISLSFNPKGEKDGVLNIYELNGQSVYAEDIPLSDGIMNREIDISALSKGIYFVEFRSGNNNFRSKLLKN